MAYTNNAQNSSQRDNKVRFMSDQESKLFLVLSSMAVGVLLTVAVLLVCAPSAFALLEDELVCVDGYRDRAS